MSYLAAIIDRLHAKAGEMVYEVSRTTGPELTAQDANDIDTILNGILCATHGSDQKYRTYADRRAAMEAGDPVAHLIHSLAEARSAARALRDSLEASASEEPRPV